MKIAYFDCFSGAAGDMIVGACLDAGADWEAFCEQIDSLGLAEVRLQKEKVQRNGIAATLFTPVIQGDYDGGHHHRHLPAIFDIIQRGRLSQWVKDNALLIFNGLGEAEARVHDIPLYQVHFHEVGAADAIVDIVGACVALELLGIDVVYSSALAVGSGTVRCEHGVLPVPAPATAELIKGIPVVAGEAGGELLTPTGAAILKTLAKQFGPTPAMTAVATGYGAGQKVFENIPNVVRLTVGEDGQGDGVKLEDVVVLVTSLDDVSGQVVGYVSELLLAAGALDVYYTAIGMKKNRPGVELTVICRPEQALQIEMLLFEQTPTLGIRRMACRRHILEREFATVETVYGPIGMKIARSAEGVRRNVAPEYGDCQNAASRSGVPLKTVIHAALLAWERMDTTVK